MKFRIRLDDLNTDREKRSEKGKENGGEVRRAVRVNEDESIIENEILLKYLFEMRSGEGSGTLAASQLAALHEEFLHEYF